MLSKLPDIFVEFPAIVCPSLLPQRRWHRVQEFKSPGWVHDCTVAVCTPAERGGGEINPGTLSKGNAGFKKAGSRLNTAQSKQSIGHKRKYIRVYHTDVKEFIVPKVRTVKLRLFTKKFYPATLCRNGTYHAIVGRARQRSAFVAVVLW